MPAMIIGGSELEATAETDQRHYRVIHGSHRASRWCMGFPMFRKSGIPAQSIHRLLMTYRFKDADKHDAFVYLGVEKHEYETHLSSKRFTLLEVTDRLESSLYDANLDPHRR